MLQRLLSVPGADPDLVTVFIDGSFQEPVEVTRLLGIRAVSVSAWGEGEGGRDDNVFISLSLSR